MSVICVIFAVVVKDLVEKKEVYKHRVDKLETKVHNMTTGLITEFFTPGRLDCLKGQKQFITLISKSLFLARFSPALLFVRARESFRMRSRLKVCPSFARLKSVWFSLSTEFPNVPSTSEHYCRTQRLSDHFRCCRKFLRKCWNLLFQFCHLIGFHSLGSLGSDTCS